jgi:wyosine [tRNA(Phe)-imidazoG37] synthetase (radical SAM superfamily)
MPIPLQPSVVYGPVHSRRLGLSLGINLLPPDRKVCNFNCVYCQYGSTHGGWENLVATTDWSSKDIILSELEKSLQRLFAFPDHLTIAGNGEPTAHPQFPEIVDGVIRLRDTYAPGAKTAILSNASFLNSQAVKQAVMKLDAKILKLDCGDDSLFRKYNRPTNGIRFDQIMQNVKGIENVTVQTLLTNGPHGNDSPPSLERWMECLALISPSMVQIYSLDRDCEDKSLKSTSPKILLEIKERLQSVAIPAEVY